MKEKDIAIMLAHCDTALNPSRELETDTVAKMTEYSRPTTLTERVLDHPKVKKSGKLTVIIAAAFMCVVMLMGAGFRVFEHIFYLPGEGIITDDMRDALVMEYATPMGTHHVEAASLMKNENGGFNLHVVTDLESRFFEDMRRLTVTTAEGFSLTEESIGKFTFKDVPESTSYTLTDDEGGVAEIELIPINSFEYSVYKYPVDHGITVIIFPLSKGSRYLAYEIGYDYSNEPEEIKTLANKSNNIRVSFANEAKDNILATDINGEVYRIIATHSTNNYSSTTGIDPEDGYTHYDSYMKLDRRPDAELANITIAHMELGFRLDLMDKKQFTVPELGEKIEFTESFVDKYSLVHKPDYLTYNTFESTLGTHYEAVLYCGSTATFPVDYVDIAKVGYIISCNGGEGCVPYDTNHKRHGYTGYTMKYNEDFGGVEWYSIHATCQVDDECFIAPGDIVTVNDTGVTLTISGDWVIDFTDKLDKPAPTVDTTVDATEAVTEDIPA